MFKKIFLITILSFFLAKPSLAFKAETFVTFSNPVRGYEEWKNEEQTPLSLPIFLYEESTPSALPITWLLRFDAVNSSTISGYFSDLVSKDTRQSLGAFLEITPSLVKEANLPYPPGFSIYNANRIFLSGYESEQRKVLIDIYMDSFFKKFGFYPKSVSAWHLDSYSLKYLQEKYSVLTAMNCDDQYGMDQYRLWGGYIGSPYFPDKNNSLIPASSLSNRVNLAMVRWAPRDFFNFYGPGISSMYSFQVNDYIGLGLNKNYFSALLKQYSQKTFNQFTHFNIGLENDYSLTQYKSEIKNVYQEIKKQQSNYNLRPILLSDFGDWFKARYPESSPAYFYKTSDPILAQSEQVAWYQSPWFRLGLKSEGAKTKLLDFRVFNRQIYEENYATPNQATSLYHEIPAIIDSVKYKDQNYKLDFDFANSLVSYQKQTDGWQVTLVDKEKRIRVGPDRIVFLGFNPPELTSKDLKVTTKGETTTWLIQPETPYANQSKTTLFIWFIFILFLLYKLFKNPKPPVFGLILSLIAATTLFRSGSLNSFGMGFWGPNGHDALFHLSLIDHFAANPFSFFHPQFSGAILQDYHFVFDYFLGLVSRATNTSPFILYFLIFPLVASITLIGLLDKLLNQWKYSTLAKNISFIFVFLGGSLGFIPRLIANQSIFSGESAFWVNQSVSMFLNPPFILSVIILLLFLIKVSKDLTIFDLLTLSLLGGLLSQTKVYAFILLLAALFLSKKIKLFCGVLIVGVLISLPFVSFSGSPFVFQPLWFTKSLFASFDRFYWPRFVQAWQTYELVGNLYKLFLINLFALVVFVLGNLGTRILGLIEIAKTSPQTTGEKVTRFIIFFGFLIPLVFTQNINPWNTIQFFYYAIFFLGLYSGKYLGDWFGNRSTLGRVSILSVIIFLTVFTSVGTLKDYFSLRSASRVSYTELEALNLLKGLPNGLVLSPLQSNNHVASPKPQYSYVSSAYISALTSQPEFMSDTINLEITGIDYKKRQKDIYRFYNTKDKLWAKNFINESNIKYLYETSLTRASINPEDLGFTKIFDSGEINLYIRAL